MVRVCGIFQVLLSKLIEAGESVASEVSPEEKVMVTVPLGGPERTKVSVSVAPSLIVTTSTEAEVLSPEGVEPFGVLPPPPQVPWASQLSVQGKSTS